MNEKIQKIEVNTHSSKDATSLMQKLSKDASRLSLPFGIIGFPRLNKIELVYSKEELPFIRMRQLDPEDLEFIVMEPQGFVPNYQVQIPNEDLDLLGIDSEEDAYILNIVTLNKSKSPQVTVNLIAPLVFNKKHLKVNR